MRMGWVVGVGMTMITVRDLSENGGRCATVHETTTLNRSSPHTVKSKRSVFEDGARRVAHLLHRQLSCLLPRFLREEGPGESIDIYASDSMRLSSV